MRVEARRRLVQAEQRGFGAHGARDLEATLRAIGKAAGGMIGALYEADAVEPVPRLRDRRRLGAAIGRQADEPAHGVEAGAHEPVVLRDDEGLQHPHAGEEPHIMEGARHPRLARDAEAIHTLNQELALGPIEREPPDARAVEAGEAVEHGGLASAVRADDGGDLAPPCGEGEVVDRDEAAEGHGQVLDLEQRRWRWRCHAALPRSPRSRKLGSRREIRPRGRHTMMATIAAPKISIRNSAKARSSCSPTRTTAASTMPS